MESIQCAGFEFFNQFDSANLAKVEHVSLEECKFPYIIIDILIIFQFQSACSEAGNIASKSSTQEAIDTEFNIWTKPDCCGTEFENSNRTWFYFGMRGSVYIY